MTLRCSCFLRLDRLADSRLDSILDNAHTQSEPHCRPTQPCRYAACRADLRARLTSALLSFSTGGERGFLAGLAGCAGGGKLLSDRGAGSMDMCEPAPALGSRCLVTRLLGPLGCALSSSAVLSARTHTA